MKYLIEISGENSSLAILEIETVLKVKLKPVHLLFYSFESTKDISKLFSRLSYSRNLYQILYTGDNFSKFDWNNLIDDSYSIRFHKEKDLEKKYSSEIYQLLKSPKVNLKNPKYSIEFYKFDKIYALLLISNNHVDYTTRLPKNRPGFHPTSLNPKLAKCLVNLTGATSSDTILDPFCGTGGLLIEATILGINSIGSDIDPDMIERTKLNYKHLKLKLPVLKIKSAIDINYKFDYLVTDLPYGKNSKITDELEKLYSDFFLMLSKNLVKCAVVSLPSYIDYKKLIKMKHVHLSDFYLHKSLSKTIIRIKK